jgi:hypothetical protein
MAVFPLSTLAGDAQSDGLDRDSAAFAPEEGLTIALLADRGVDATAPDCQLKQPRLLSNANKATPNATADNAAATIMNPKTARSRRRSRRALAPTSTAGEATRTTYAVTSGK